MRSALALKALLQPHLLVKALLTKTSFGSFEFRLAWDAFPRPWLAYGIFHAARLAKQLGFSEIAIVEFGVAMGDGLVQMERIAEEVSRVTGVAIRVIGFDTGVGMPAHSDYRDLPYIWQKGHYQMDVDQVRSRLRKAELILGDVADTVPRFLAELGETPIGFVAFDLDYYTSTQAALRVFEGSDSRVLPRVFCYFDDVIGSDEQVHCEDVGELLAIKEFNQAGEHGRLRQISALASKRMLASAWAPQMWCYHRFNHVLYDRYIGGSVSHRA